MAIRAFHVATAELSTIASVPRRAPDLLRRLPLGGLGQFLP
jgi:hypothetical protein